ncbi:cysteine hydrolase family protein [Bacillus sp. 3255]|uniref:cysteine hydrolase family protein n=1 Tax=Bacillus sp. 3255 TaxID=2817904 RepID=UPI00286C685D|nr:cysteine hydrolase family protein [Bacillus sp. 3255]
MSLIAPKTPLLMIDVQKAFDDPKWGERNNKDAEDNMKVLLKAWRSSGRPVMFVQHVSPIESSLFYHNQPTCQFKTGIEPMGGEHIFLKNVNSSFIGTNLEQVLRQMACEQIVIVGLTTNHCVETTTRMAGNLGFNPILVEDACATFGRSGPDGTYHTPENIHEMTLVNLHEEFAQISTTSDVLAIIDYHESYG